MGKATKIASLALFMVLVGAFPGAMIAAATGSGAPVAVEAVCPANPLTSNTGILNAGQGMTATATFTIAAGCSTSVTLVSYTAPSATFSFDTANQQVLFASQTATGVGEHTLSVKVPACFFQVDLVFGAPIAHLGPADSGNFYSAQGRLIQGINGGTTACTETVTPPATETPPVVVVTPPVVVVTPPVVVVTVPTVTVTPPPTVIPAGPITWAPGFGPNGVVASVQTAPMTTTTTTTTPTTTTTTTRGAVLGTQSLPSTSTAGDSPQLGLALCLLGFTLLAGAALSTVKTKS